MDESPPPEHKQTFTIVCFLLTLFLTCSISSGSATVAPSSSPEKKSAPTVSPVIIEAANQPVPGGTDTPDDLSKSSQNENLPSVKLLNETQAKTLNRQSTQGGDIPLVDSETEEQLDALQEKGSTLVISAADWIDSFFDDTRYVAEENRTRAKIKLEVGYSRYDDLEFDAAIDLRIHLPSLEDKANIFLRLNDDNDFDVDSNPISNADGQTSKEDQLTAGLQYFLAMGEQYNVSTEVGFSYNYVYGGIRYRYLHSIFNDDWDGRFTNRLRYYSNDGWEDKASYDIETYFGERFFYRTTFTALFSEPNDGVPFSVLARLYQVFNIDSAILYDIGGYFDTEPDLSATDVQLRVRYRQRFYRDWLVLEVAPQVTFPQEYDYNFNPGLVFKFEFDFGYLKDRKAYQNVFTF